MKRCGLHIWVVFVLGLLQLDVALDCLDAAFEVQLIVAMTGSNNVSSIAVFLQPYKVWQAVSAGEYASQTTTSVASIRMTLFGLKMSNCP